MARDLGSVGEEIIGLAGDIAAATARWLELVAEFDRREGWKAEGCHSCAHWLMWKCGIAPSTAHEQVKVARALVDFPLVAQAFAAGGLTYCRVRAVLRMATPDTEAELVDLARVCTGSHLARIARAHRRALRDPDGARRRQRLRWDWDDEGDFVVTARVPAEVGRRFLHALHVVAQLLEPESAAADSPPGAGSTDSTGTRADTGGADVFAALIEAALAGAVTDSAPPPPEVVVTVAAEDLTGGADQEVARRLSCDATTATLLHDSRGTPLDLGRRRRTVNPALRLALRQRDGGCRFPGCSHTRFTHAHHIVHWAHGGSTALANLVTLCTFHHRLVHEGGYHVEADLEGAIRFYGPDRTLLADRCIDMTGCAPPTTGFGGEDRIDGLQPISPTWAGERLDLGHTIDSLVQARTIAENRRRLVEESAAA